MSTRSIIAFGTGLGDCRSTYHHWDGYPAGLGQALYKLYQEWGAERMEHTLIEEHPSGWSNIVDVDWENTPGFHTYGNGPQCYCHGERSDGPLDIPSPVPAGYMGSEWLYLVCPDRTMHIYEALRPKGEHATGAFGVNPGAQVWQLVATVALGGPAPDWEAMQ